jgi:hypothetical protein
VPRAQGVFIQVVQPGDEGWGRPALPWPASGDRGTKSANRVLTIAPRHGCTRQVRTTRTSGQKSDKPVEEIVDHLRGIAHLSWRPSVGPAETGGELWLAG